MTIGDRIRAMDNEQLADFLLNIYIDDDGFHITFNFENGDEYKVDRLGEGFDLNGSDIKEFLDTEYKE